VSYGGSQLAAADSFLRQHDDRVDVILLSLGGGDVIAPATFDCENDDACLKAKLPEILRRVEPNFDRILDHLKALAPRATVVVLIEYHLVGISDIVNIGLSGVYRRVREEGYEHRAVVVESDPIIQPHVCAFTMMCSDTAYDIHPTDIGYRAIAAALFRATEREREELLAN
jgi:hypothetical protein